MRVLGARHAAERIGVRRAVALAVVRPGLLGTIRLDAPDQLPLHRPGKPGRRAHRIDHSGDTSEGVPPVTGRPAQRIGDLHRQPGRVAPDAGGGAQRVRHRRGMAQRVVRVAGRRAGGVGDGGAPPRAVERLVPRRAVRIRDRHRLAQLVVRGRGRASVRTDDRRHPPRLVAAVLGGAAERVRTRAQPVVAVPPRMDGRPRGIDLGDDLERPVDDVTAGVAEGVGERRDAQAGVRVPRPVLQSGPHMALGPGLEDTAVPRVVRVLVAAVITVRPRRDAPALVVLEPQRQPGGVDDLRQVGAGVAVPHQLRIGPARPAAHQVQRRDAPSPAHGPVRDPVRDSACGPVRAPVRGPAQHLGRHADAIAAVVDDRRRHAVRVPLERDPVAVPVGYLLQRGGPGPVLAVRA